MGLIFERVLRAPPGNGSEFGRSCGITPFWVYIFIKLSVYQHQIKFTESYIPIHRVKANLCVLS